MACAALLSGLEAKWDTATSSHPFLCACVDGTVTAEQFNTWLVQDYFYVRGFTPFAGAVLASAPDAHLEVLIGGVAALGGELAWFRDKAAQRGLDLANTAMQPACTAYRALLQELHDAPYAVQAAALWAIEACYHQAWGKVLAEGRTEAYKEFASRWGSPEFGIYVDQLAAHVESALEAAPDQAAAAKAVVERIADLEDGFWGMAFAGGAA